jgi:hypothetical protein
VNEHHYQRIDKGVSRKYPDIPAKSSGITTHRPLQTVPEARRHEIAQEVLSRYLHGEQVAAMAPEYETSDVTLYALILKDHEEEWKDAQIARALARFEKNQSLLEVASDPLSLARARELVRSAQWELERILSRIFGQKQEHTHVILDLGDRLRRARERVIDQAPIDNQPNTGVMSNPQEAQTIQALPEPKDPDQKK